MIIWCVIEVTIYSLPVYSNGVSAAIFPVYCDVVYEYPESYVCYISTRLPKICSFRQFQNDVFGVKHSSLCLIAHPLGGSNRVHLAIACFQLILCIVQKCNFVLVLKRVFRQNVSLSGLLLGRDYCSISLSNDSAYMYLFA